MQQVEELAPHVEEVNRALENRVDKSEIEDELRRYLEYGVPLDRAKREIVRNHGGTLKTGPKTLDKLTAGERNVDVRAKVLTVNPKDITVKGEPKTIYYGFLADETAKITYTAWKDHNLEPGKVYDFGNLYAKEGFRGGVELNIGDYANIRETDAEMDAVDDVPAGGGMGPAGRGGQDLTVKELTDGLGSVNLTVRVLEANPKTITTAKGDRDLVEGELADETGKVPFTCWAPDVHGDKLQTGNVLELKNAYVKTWRGVPNVNFGENAQVELQDAEALPDAEALSKDKPFTIGELEAAGGASGVVVEGIILEVKKGSGLILRCARDDCNRVLQKKECRIHGRNDGIPDLRIKAVLDDGYGALTFFLGREGTEQLLGKTLEEARKMATEAMDMDVVQTELEDNLTGHRLRVHGNATSDEYGLQLIASEARPPKEVDVRAKAEELLGKVSAFLDTVKTAGGEA